MPLQNVFIQRTSAQSQRRQLAQSTNTSTGTADILYSPPDGTETFIKQIYVCNSTASSAQFRFYHDEDGTKGLTAVAALFYDKTIAANDTLVIDTEIYMNDPDGELGIETSPTAALVFTLYGEEIQVRAR